MLLQFRSPHWSITQFDPIELPTFTVLTGVNGAGKSHLLQAIANGSVQIDDIHQDEIVLFSAETFRLDDQNSMSVSQTIQERHNGWDFFKQGGNPNIRPNLEQYKNNLGSCSDRIMAIAIETGKAIWELTEDDGLSASDYRDISNYKRQVYALLRSPSFRGNQQAESILTLCKKLNKFADSLEYDEFCALYEPRQFKENFLPAQITLAFTDYYSKLEENQYKAFRNNQCGESNKILDDAEFRTLYGPKPWDLMNQILDQLGTMPYYINYPEGIDRFSQFKAELIHKESNIRPGFSALSSGEKVLIALVTSVYKGSSDKNFPRILLLDEIDASLHPSMMHNMLDIIQSAFIENSVSVILVTHSPTTVALCPTPSIHVMHPSGQQRIENCSNADALGILAEGFITLTQGMSILDEIARKKVSVITEGKNIDLFRKAFEFADLRDVELIEGVSDRSGSNQLRTLFDFLCKMQHNSKIIVAWDCDANKYRNLSPQNNTYPFVFEKNDENDICSKGIENLFLPILLGKFLKTIQFANGDLKKEFDDSQKSAFNDFILSRNNRDDFEKFDPFVEFVREIAETKV